MTNLSIIDDLLTRGVANIISDKDSLTALLTSGKTLNIYLGIDPTSTSIHLGHAFPLRKMQQFVDLGHNVSFLIGDFTALVGDTSDKDSERPILTPQQIQTNFETYKSQAQKLLDFSKVKEVHNSDWLKDLTFADLIKLMQQFSVNDFISRELIRKRIDEGKSVRLDEMLYPIMQGYDSLHLDTDIQLGGTDQTFNMQAGRTLLKNLKNKDSFIISNSFLTGTDGRKMSKSWGNAIWLTDEPEDMYGKVMSIKDELLEEYFTLATNLPLDEVKTILDQSPLEAKKRLATQIVTELHSKEDAQQAAASFTAFYQKKAATPADLPKVTTGSALDLLSPLDPTRSRTQIKSLIAQGSATLDDLKITDFQQSLTFKTGSEVTLGKHIHLKFK